MVVIPRGVVQCCGDLSFLDDRIDRHPISVAHVFKGGWGHDGWVGVEDCLARGCEGHWLGVTVKWVLCVDVARVL